MSSSVGKPHITDAGCWAQVRRHTGSLVMQETACGNRPRLGALTCGRHAYLEGSAQQLAAYLEGKAVRA